MFDLDRLGLGTGLRWPPVPRPLHPTHD